MKKPVITRDCVKTLLETKYLKVYDLQYEEGKHYNDATRREADRLTALMSDGEFLEMQPDAVSCCVIVRLPGEEPKLLLSYEYRYPCGRFLLSPPAGLIDPEDRDEEDALIRTAVREIREETGLEVKPSDRVYVANPCVFSSPGMTDECNAMVCAVVDTDSLDQLNQEGAVGTEAFDGFLLATRQEAEEILRSGRDPQGFFYSVFTWVVLAWFAGGFWKK
ncbi:MAG: NUDIX hydrolase [Firmicutes bacterium]|nr:NUDIX hydrolase [Bacillota bacterium]